jgi:hypothetical protein
VIVPLAIVVLAVGATKAVVAVSVMALERYHNGPDIEVWVQLSLWIMIASLTLSTRF